MERCPPKGWCSTAQLELDLVDVGSLTREVCEKVEALGDRRWVVDDVADGAIVGDRQRLEQAMIQLAQNAAEHTEPGGEIGLGSDIDDGWATLWVRDSGPGIPFDQQDRIFERFSRSGPRRAEGAGLGLAIVRAIAEAHKGRAGIRSAVGAGATFFMEVPVDQHPGGTDPG